MDNTPTPRRRTGGRRTKLTPETHERIITAVRAGATFDAAAGAAGVDQSTLYRWLREAEHPEAPAWKRQFRYDIYRARDELEIRIVAGSVMKGALGGYVLEETTETRRDGTVVERRRYAPADARSGLEILARRFHDRGWGRQPTELAGPGGGAIQVEHSAALGELAARLHEEMAVEGAPEGEVLEGSVEQSFSADEGEF